MACSLLIWSVVAQAAGLVRSATLAPASAQGNSSVVKQIAVDCWAFGHAMIVQHVVWHMTLLPSMTRGTADGY